MEIAIPLVALSGLYFMSNQSSRNEKDNTTEEEEGFRNNVYQLPNENIPDRNYPEEYPVQIPENDRTSYLSVNNKFEGNGVYTDKFFNPNVTSKNVSNGTLAGGGLTGNETAYSNTYGSGSVYTSMTGDKVGGEYFNHNNMVPFFGSRLRTNKGDVNSSEGVLDNTVGAGSQYVSKKEQSPMFSPHGNLQWATGTPNNTDFIKSRMNVSAKMSGVKPFEDQKVGPGLGLGFTNEGLGGFNSGMGMREMWVDRGVDDLRVANKPKSSGHNILGYEGPAGSFVKKNATPQNIGNFNKNRPDTYFEMGTDRLFTTMGVQTAPTARGILKDGFSHRGEAGIDTSYVGGATSAAAGQHTYTTGENTPSHRQQLEAYPFTAANAVGRNTATEADFGMNSQYAYPNSRSSNEQNDYFGIIGGSVGAVVAPLLDALRPSRKENTIGTLRPYQNPKPAVSNSYIFNPADRPSTTVRETTGKSKEHWNVNAQAQGAYPVAGNQAVDTNRMTTGDFYYAGGSSAVSGTQKPASYVAGYNQRNNDIKSSTIDGYMVQGNMDLFNPNVNISNKPKEVLNRRDGTPLMPSQSPDMVNFGQLQGNKQLYQNIQLDRNNGDVLSSLQGNPFALSVVGGV